MASSDAADLVELLRRRRSVVEQVRDDPSDKRELVDALGVSRSTVDRATRELETAGVVEYVGGAYTTTPFGDLLVDGYASLTDTIATARHLDPFLRWLPDDETAFDPRAFTDATLHLPTPGDPYAMVNRHVHVLRESDHIRAATPVTGRHPCGAIHETVMNGGRSTLIVSPAVAWTLRSSAYVDLFEEMAETGRHTVFVTDEPLPYYVGVLDDTVQVGVDEDGKPRALLESTADEAIAWAEERFGWFLDRSRELVF